MSGDDVVRFSGIPVEVIKFQVNPQRFIQGGNAICTTRPASQGSRRMRKQKFPGAAPDSLKFALVVIEKIGLMRILRARFSCEDGPDVSTVDRERRQRSRELSGNGGKNV